jgi:acyl-CoA thioester hydrolase
MNGDIMSTLLAGYPVVVPVVVQWGDQDAIGHVNNTIFLRWMEVGRIAYFSAIRLRHAVVGEGEGPILASVTCNFRRQVTFPDEVHVGTRVTRIGTSSIQIEHAIASVRHGAIVADGHSTIVHYDYAGGRSSPVPAEVRRAIEELQAGAPLPGEDTTGSH